MSTKYKFIDLFAGCGGLAEGFLQAKNYDCIASVEWLKPQVDTLRHRLKTKWGYPNADEKVLHFDLQREDELFDGWQDDKEFGSSQGLDYFVNKSNGIDIVIGGPPCQAYSIAGRVRDSNGMENDYRNYLFERYLNVVKKYQPKVFIFENVLGLLSAKPHGINIVEQITKEFEEIGYIIPSNLKNAVINSSDYGVPQNRKRVIILGIHKEYFKFERPQEILLSFYNDILHKYKVDKKVTVEEAIADLDTFTPTFDEEKHKKRHAYDGVSTTSWHKPRYHNARDMKIYAMLAKDIESGRLEYTSAEAKTALYEKYVGSKSSIHRYHVLKADEPSTTIIAHLYKDGNRFIHYDSSQARSITPRESARLQSFDDDFEFIGTQTSVFQMVGNAVPPKLGLALGKALNDFMQEYGK